MDPSVPVQTRVTELTTRLRALANPANTAGMARYGISTANALGVSVARLREIAADFKQLRKSHPEHVHEVAGGLWDSGIHEARILAGLVDEPLLVTRDQAERWALDIDSWDLCDQVCGLFGQSPLVETLIAEWTRRDEEFVKRAGFVIVCHVTVHDKRRSDASVIAYLAHAEREATDERGYVKKAVNWSIRQIGKRSGACHTAAVESAERILAQYPGSRAARWTARGALRELNGAEVMRRVFG